ncbi:MAG: RHS repeat-associated core domain-containing protein [Bacteroidales bacterium]|nr:RHS repeat-associated core domain-containing protein [Candidatus Cryptobacteroides aphodequi]
MKRSLFSFVASVFAFISASSLIAFAQGTGSVGEQLVYLRGETLLEKTLPPAPEAASVTRYADIPFSGSLGSATYEVPAFTLKGRELSINIGLNYSSNGIKLDEIAGVAGLGWTLSAGGCITRTVMDMPDEFYGAELHHEMPDSALLASLATGDAQNIQSPAFAYMRDVAWHRIDASRDRYSYSVCGLSGEFVINDDGEVVHLSGDGCRIVFYADTDDNILSFVITGPDGTVYRFAEREISTHDGTLNPGHATPLDGERDIWTATTAWHLSEVASRSALESATFSYVSGGTWQKNVHPSSTTITASEGLLLDNQVTTSINSQHIINSTATKVLSAITLSGYSATFSYEGNTGHDKHSSSEFYYTDNFPVRLTAISVTAPGGAGLGTLYVGTGREPHDGRIILSSLRFYRGGSLQDRWDFTYDTRDDEVHCASQDWYGYFNAGYDPQYHLDPYPGGDPFGPLLGGNIVNPQSNIPIGRECPYEFINNSPELRHGTPDAEAASYMSLLSADHDGAVTSYSYEGASYSSGSLTTTIGVRVAAIDLSDGTGVRQRRTYTYSDPYADGAAFPDASMYLTSSVPAVTSNSRTWSFTLHETPVEEGLSLRDTRVLSRQVTEERSDGSTFPLEKVRIVHHYNPSFVRLGPHQVIDRFPRQSEYQQYHSSLLGAIGPMDGIRESYFDSGPSGSPLLTREEEYSVRGDAVTPVSIREYTYGDEYRDAVLVGYKASQVWDSHPLPYGEIIEADTYHYPIYAATSPSRVPTLERHIECHASGNDTLVVEKTYLERSSFEKPVRLSGMSVEEDGLTRGVSFTYADSWEDAPQWASELAGQHCLAEPLRKHYYLGRIVQQLDPVTPRPIFQFGPVIPQFPPEGYGRFAPYEFSHDDITEYGFFFINGRNRLLPSVHRELTDGHESWRETVVSRDRYGNIAQYEAKGGPVTGLVWSHNGLYPVAAIENSGIAAVNAELEQMAVDPESLASATAPSQTEMDALDALRSRLPSAHVTTYTHNPGVGVTSICDVSGVRTYYEYDSGGRLSAIKDYRGDTLEDFEYSLLCDALGHRSITHRTYRNAAGTLFGEDRSWWDALGLKLQDLAVAASGNDGQGLVTAYDADWLLHDDAAVWVPFAVSDTLRSFCTDAPAAAAAFNGSALAFAHKSYELSSAGRVEAEALPGFIGSHESTVARDVSDGNFPILIWRGSSIDSIGRFAACEITRETTTDADGRSTTLWKDHFGRTMGSAIGNDAPTYYIYDKYDYLRAVAGSGIALSDTLSMWRYSYDTLGRLQSKGMPGSIREHYAYDSGDRIAAIRKGSELTTFDYDAFGRVTARWIEQNGGSRVALERHWYDGGSLPMSNRMFRESVYTPGPFEDPGVSIGLELYAQTAEIGPDGTVTGTAETLYGYDSKGRPSRIVSVYPDGSVLKHSYSYNFDGSVAQEEYSCMPAQGAATDSLRLQNSYDRRGRLTGSSSTFATMAGAQHSTSSASTQHSYDAWGRAAGRTTSAGEGPAVISQDTFNLQGWLTEHEVTLGGRDLLTQTFGYEGNNSVLWCRPSYTGLITSRSEVLSTRPRLEPVSIQLFAYDGAGRLQMDGTSTRAYSTYSYDARGNLTSATQVNRLPVTTQAYTYSGDRLVDLDISDNQGRIAYYDFEHDERGRMTFDGRGGHNFTYNCLDLPSTAGSARYSYLADGSLVSELKSNGEGIVLRGPFAYRRAADGTLTFESAVCPEGRLTADAAILLVTDHLGSVRAAVDGTTGTLLEASDYSVWGERSDKAVGGSLPEGLTLRDHFSGKEDQSVEFALPYLNFGARFYAPDLKRWLTIDPLSEKYYGVSPYAYCADNPVNLVDPDGKDWYMADDNTIKWTEHTSQTELDKSKVNGRYLGPAVVVFSGSRDEKLGKDNTLGGDGGLFADVSVYGPDGTTDNSLIGYTMTSDPNLYNPIDDGEYAVVRREGEGKGTIPKHYWVKSENTKGELLNSIRTLDGLPNKQHPEQIYNGEGYMTDIFIHTTVGKNNIVARLTSQGCLLLKWESYMAFDKMLSPLGNGTPFKLILTRKNQ